MASNEDILKLVRQKGPILPVQVTREIQESLLMTSARLSELLSNKQIKVSNLKIGGSPLYYVEGQEEKLQNYSDNLEEKEKEAYSLLKQKKVLRDSEQTPSLRVALREIRDFAVPLQVSYRGKNEVFWKWYLTNSDEANKTIREVLTKEKQPQKQGMQEIPKEQAEPKQEKTGEKSKVEEQKEEIEKKLEKPKKAPKTKKESEDNFLKEVQKFFEQNNIRITETNVIKKNSEIDFIIELKTSVGNAKYYCKARSKKRVNDGDVSSAVLKSQARGMPLLFLTSGKATKKLQESLKEDFKNIIYKEI